MVAAGQQMTKGAGKVNAVPVPTLEPNRLDSSTSFTDREEE
jgi:hypothetical protein